MDKDILLEIGKNQSFLQAQTMTTEIVRWTVRQVTSIIRRKRMDLLEKRPGAVCETKIIFTRMLKRVGTFCEQSLINNIVQLRAKMNDALNDIVPKMEHYILTINGCNSYEHFDKAGKLSVKGKNAFWHEMDDLMRRFDVNHLKLLPNPKNPPWQFGRSQHRKDHYNDRHHRNTGFHHYPKHEVYDEYFTIGSKHQHGQSPGYNTHSNFNRDNKLTRSSR